MASQTFHLTAGKIVAKVLVGGVQTLTTFSTPASSFTMPYDGTFTIGWDYKDNTGAALATPRFVLFPGQSSSTYPNMLPLHLVTQMGSTLGSGRLTHAIDKRQLGGIGSNNIQSSAVNSTHLDPSIIASLTAAGALATLSDVHLVSPANRDVLSYNAGTAKWTNTVAASGGGTGGGSGATSLNGLSDVAITSPTTGQFFEYNGSVWTNVTGITYAQLPSVITNTISASGNVNASKLTGTIPASCYIAGSPTLAGDTDVTFTSLTTGQFVKYNGTKFVNSFATLSGLSDVSVSGVTSSMYLNYNGANWVANVLPTTHLYELGDVTYSSAPIAGDVLTYHTDFPHWTNAQPTAGTTSLSALTDCSIGTPSNGEILQYLSSDNLWHAHIPVLNDLTDVRVTSPGGNNYLGFNGTDNLWENAPINTYSLADFSYARAPADRDVITYVAADGYFETSLPNNPVYDYHGAYVAKTMHSVIGEFTATTTSVTIVFGTNAIFANDQYMYSILDKTSKTPVLTAWLTKTATSFKWTATSGHTYDYFFQGI